MGQRCDLPSINNGFGEAVGYSKVALDDQNDVYDVAIVGPAGAVVQVGVEWIRHGRRRHIA